MSETIRNLGHLKQNELDLRKAELEIKGLVAAIRDCLDPFAAIADLRADVAAQQALALSELHIRWQELSSQNIALKKALRM